MNTTEECDKCGGLGSNDEGDVCAKCRGNGYVKLTEIEIANRIEDEKIEQIERKYESR